MAISMAKLDCGLSLGKSLLEALHPSLCIIEVIGLVSNGCSQQKSSPKQSKTSQEKGLAQQNAKEKYKPKSKSLLLPQKMPKAKDRLLEYRVSYTIKCDDLALARSQILRFGQDYGFLAHIQTEMAQRQWGRRQKDPGPAQ